MKKKRLFIMFIVLFTATIVGCGSEASDEVKEITAEKIVTSEASVEERETAEDSFTFACLADRQFEFSSGAGGWSEAFTIEKDGYFTGNYHDSDMGDTGEGYSQGTFYSSAYSGHFTELTKINEYTYQMKLADISYKEKESKEEIIDNTRYIYTESYCLGGTDTFTIYLPGTPLSEISQEAYSWLSMMNESDQELTMMAIVDETNGYGIYSYERLTPWEDAQMTFNSYKESYDYYQQKLSEAGTTLEMVECTGTMYELSDDCLNYIWNLIRYNVKEDKYQEILTEQRKWIADKETKAKEASAAYEGGSFATVSYNETLASLTIERCEVLLKYLSTDDVTQEPQVSEQSHKFAQEKAPIISVTSDKKQWFAEEDKSKCLLEVTSSMIAVEGEEYSALKEALAKDFPGIKEENFENLLEDAKDDYNSRTKDNEDYFYGYSSVENAQLTRSDRAVVSFRLFFSDYMGGAHGMYAYGGSTYDTESGELLALEDILTDAKGFYAKAIDNIQHELEEMYGEGLYPDYKNYIAGTFDADRMLNWYMNGSGIVITYNPYEVGPYAMGAPEVLLPYSEFGVYMNEKYLTAGREVIARIPMNQDVSKLIGEKEKIIINGKNDEWEMLSVSMLSGANTDTLGTFGSFEDAYVIKRADGRSFVLVVCDYMSDDYVTFVYEVTGNMLQKCSELSNASIQAEYISTDEILMNVRVDALGTYTAKVHYSLKENGQLVVLDDIFKIDTENTLTLIKDLPVLIEGTETTLSAGTEMIVTGTNNVDEVYFKVVNSGQVGTIRYTKDEWTHLIDGVSEYEYFDTIPYAG